MTNGRGDPAGRGRLGDVKVQHVVSFALGVERSRFFAVLVPMGAPDGIDAVVRARRSEIRRANHHCWAYRVADASGAIVEKSKDDGEVGHPGRVLLEILRRYDLEGAIVVSRVFGGVKLGVGGVSRAFRDAGEGAIETYRARLAPLEPKRSARG
jgi:putative IMPACT (imprinted ancient) family translation regulator